MRREGGEYTIEELAKVTVPAPIYNVDIVDTGFGTYMGYYYATQPGIYWLEVKYGGEHITGSPFNVTVTVAEPDNLGFGFYSGRRGSSARDPDSMPLPPCRSVSGGVLRNGFWKTEAHWQPIQCNINEWTTSTVVSCVKDTSILFVGDSLNRCLFWAFVSRMAQSQPFVLWEPVKPGDIKTNVIYPQEQKSHNTGWDQLYFELFPKINATVTYRTIWNSAAALNYPQEASGRVRAAVRLNFFSLRSFRPATMMVHKWHTRLPC